MCKDLGLVLKSVLPKYLLVGGLGMMETKGRIEVVVHFIEASSIGGGIYFL